MIWLQELEVINSSPEYVISWTAWRTGLSEDEVTRRLVLTLTKLLKHLPKAAVDGILPKFIQERYGVLVSRPPVDGAGVTISPPHTDNDGRAREVQQISAADVGSVDDVLGGKS